MIYNLHNVIILMIIQVTKDYNCYGVQMKIKFNKKELKKILSEYSKEDLELAKELFLTRHYTTINDILEHYCFNGNDTKIRLSWVVEK